MTANELALQMHKKWNGKIETTAKSHVRTREDLAIAYTPGVAEPCKVIAKDPTAAYTYTMKANTIAVVSDGSAVLGLGNIGALAGMPVMEGKAVLFKELLYLFHRKPVPLPGGKLLDAAQLAPEFQSVCHIVCPPPSGLCPQAPRGIRGTRRFTTYIITLRIKIPL